MEHGADLLDECRSIDGAKPWRVIGGDDKGDGQHDEPVGDGEGDSSAIQSFVIGVSGWAGEPAIDQPEIQEVDAFSSYCRRLVLHQEID